MRPRCFLPVLALVLLLPVPGVAEDDDTLSRLTPLEQLGLLEAELKEQGAWEINAELFVRRADECAVMDHSWYGQVAGGQQLKKVEKLAKQAAKCWARLAKQGSGNSYADDFVKARLGWTEVQLRAVRSLQALLAKDNKKRCKALKEGITFRAETTALFDSVIERTVTEDQRVYLDTHRREVERVTDGLAEQIPPACGEAE